MLLNLKIHNEKGLFGISASILFHLSLFLIALFFSSYRNAGSFSGSYVQVYTGEFDYTGSSEFLEDKKPETVKDIPEEKPVKEEETIGEKGKQLAEDNSKQITSDNNEGKAKGSAYMSFVPGTGDTSALQNIYSESSLNVSIRYPFGWTFLDQKVRNKLDGVTFWSPNSGIDPPPYVHLEVKEKYIFNPSRFKLKEELDDFTIYYNEPEELEEQVSQIFYIRTEDDEDFSLKLIIKGKDNFKAFQPVFFGMLKTFKFGNSLF